jgi:mercuric ion binding protein
MHRSFAAALLAIGLGAAAPALAGEKTITLAVENMNCSACPLIVKTTLQAVPGVTKVVVSYAHKTATVTFDEAKTAVPALTTATTNAGYPSAPKS